MRPSRLVAHRRGFSGEKHCKCCGLGRSIYISFAVPQIICDRQLCSAETTPGLRARYRVIIQQRRQQSTAPVPTTAITPASLAAPAATLKLLSNSCSSVQRRPTPQRCVRYTIAPPAVTVPEGDLDRVVSLLHYEKQPAYENGILASSLWLVSTNWYVHTITS